MQSQQADGELTAGGPVARMMMSAAGHAITHYVQFRALAEELIARGVIDRQALESRFELMRENALEQTIDEWFPPDVAYHLKMAIKAAEAHEAGGSDSVAPPEAEEVARARAMQSGT
jgi:hypothetical protein